MPTFYAIALKKDQHGKAVPTSLRMSGYKSAKSASLALDKRKLTGYVKQYGVSLPVYWRT